MSLIPPSTLYTVDRGARGVVVWALQRSLNMLGWTLLQDGVYGPDTERKVQQYQSSNGLTVDGRFGPASSRQMASSLEELIKTSVPVGLVRGVVQTESGGLMGAVNTSSPGGIDCGYVQRRVYQADYANVEVVRRAFDGLYQMGLLARSLRGRHDAFFGRAGARTHERAWRLAALHHNYPLAADKISTAGIGGLSSYWTTPADWVKAIGAEFADGEPVRTPLNWCEFYALGSAAHGDLGATTRYVAQWTT